MKVSKIIFASAIALIAFTGCGEKKLVCKRSDKNDDMKMEQKATMTFKDDSLDKIKLFMDVELSDEYLEQKSQIIERLTTDTITVKETSNGFTAETTRSGSDFKELGFDSESLSYEDIKKTFVDGKYECE